MPETTENLMDATLRELNRNRELLEEYKKIPQGAFGAAMITQLIQRTEKAIDSGDTVELIICYGQLQESQ